MKKRTRVLIIVVIFAVVASSFLHIFVNAKGKSLLIGKLTQIFHKPVSVGSLSTSFPFDLHIKNLEVKDLFKIDEVFARGGLIDIFRKSLVLTELKLDGAVLNIEKPSLKPVKSPEPATVTPGNQTAPSPSPDNQVVPSPVPEHQPVPAPPQAQAAPLRIWAPGLILKHLVINRGTFNFTDKSVGDKPITITVKDVSLNLENLNLPVRYSAPTSFELKGRIPWSEGQADGKLEADGWINLLKRGAEARLKIEGVDAVYIQPYYSQWINLEKARIEKAKLNFSSDIHGLNNNLTAECHLELNDVVVKPYEASEGKPDKAAKIAATVLDIFRSLNQGKIALDFTVRTKMDKLELGLGIIQTAVRDKLVQSRKGDKPSVTDIVMLPEKLVEGTVKGMTDVSLAVIDGTFAVGNELRKALFGAFKKEK